MNNLGIAGNVDTAIATIEAARGMPLHLAHLQFYAYGTGGKRGFSSAAAPLAEAVNGAKNITVDVGQVMFGPTFTVSLDVLRQYNGSQHARPRKSVIFDGDANGGGIVPYDYRRSDFYNAVQWACGLELFLLIDNPWRVFFTTDHPNGAPFTTYPDLFALLMSRDLRAQWLAEMPRSVAEMTTLASIDREYSLQEIATMTRAAPAKLLGLADRGHLGSGARADIAVYDNNNDNRAAMFRDAHLVFKDGDLVVRHGEVTHYRAGRTLESRPDFGHAIERRLDDYYEEVYRAPRDLVTIHAEALPHADMFEEVSHRPVNIRGVAIDDTFAEAFAMAATAITITGPTRRWAMNAATSMTGFATSIIGCGCEAGIDRELRLSETPDRRPGVRVIILSMSPQELQKQLANRLGQCILTAPGSACFAGVGGATRLKLGDAIRYFGDGWQISKRVGDGRHFWRVPVMDGEFLCEATTGLVKRRCRRRQPSPHGPLVPNHVARGRGGDRRHAHSPRCDHAVSRRHCPLWNENRRQVQGHARLHQRRFLSDRAWCGRVALDPSIASVLEIVIDGLGEAAVAGAMRAGLKAIVRLGPKRGAVRVSAGNYGGGLGPFKFHLKELVA